jgi:hypothetical protein
MSAPASNATITTVTGPATIDRYGDPATSSTLWSGTVRGYLKRPRMIRTGTDREEDLKTDTFTIQGEPASPILQSLASGPDAESVTVTIIDQRKPTSVTNTYKVKGLEILAAGSVADSVRLELRREGPA